MATTMIDLKTLPEGTFKCDVSDIRPGWSVDLEGDPYATPLMDESERSFCEYQFVEVLSVDEVTATEVQISCDGIASPLTFPIEHQLTVNYPLEVRAMLGALRLTVVATAHDKGFSIAEVEPVHNALFESLRWLGLSAEQISSHMKEGTNE